MNEWKPRVRNALLNGERRADFTSVRGDGGRRSFGAAAAAASPSSAATASPASTSAAALSAAAPAAAAAAAAAAADRSPLPPPDAVVAPSWPAHRFPCTSQTPRQKTSFPAHFLNPLDT